eukprot:CAMPEP_0116013500 /NCGR_PEP_ID=MMETSP0321-20121206/5762_1 /TAXON_ID=163516 /ORGANISM="Leptocylindrus danicus var. danicus, Strain B650" /LENGTH=724 /DNA_ID=CAMNT_0003483059 /DNA_START=60 /DNA_END=2235 /DNA_ORIENTATION=-
MSTLLLQKDDDDAPRSSVVRRRSTRQRKMPTSTTAHSNHNNNNSPILNDNLRPISQVKTWKTKHWAAYLNEKVPLEAKAGFDQACFVMLGDDDDGDVRRRDAYSLWPALEINPQNIIQIVEKIKCLPSSTQTRKKSVVGPLVVLSELCQPCFDWLLQFDDTHDETPTVVRRSTARLHNDPITAPRMIMSRHQKLILLLGLPSASIDLYASNKVRSAALEATVAARSREQQDSSTAMRIAVDGSEAAIFDFDDEDENVLSEQYDAGMALRMKFENIKTSKRKLEFLEHLLVTSNASETRKQSSARKENDDGGVAPGACRGYDEDNIDCSAEANEYAGKKEDMSDEDDASVSADDLSAVECDEKSNALFTKVKIRRWARRAGLHEQDLPSTRKCWKENADRIPEEVKSRYLGLCFCQREKGGRYLPAIELGPDAAKMWYGDLFDQIVQRYQQLKWNREKLIDTHFVYWFDKELYSPNAFSCLEANRYISYAEGLKLGYNKVPHAIQQKLDKGRKLTDHEQALYTAAMRMKEQAMIPPKDRLNHGPERREHRCLHLTKFDRTCYRRNVGQLGENNQLLEKMMLDKRSSFCEENEGIMFDGGDESTTGTTSDDTQVESDRKRPRLDDLERKRRNPLFEEHSRFSGTNADNLIFMQRTFNEFLVNYRALQSEVSALKMEIERERKKTKSLESERDAALQRCSEQEILNKRYKRFSAMVENEMQHLKGKK